MEQTFSGYCRTVDGARMVLCEREGEEWDVDCAFFHCAYAQGCPIGQQIATLLQGHNSRQE